MLPSADQMRAELARRNFIDFVTFTKSDYQVNWHHDLLADYLDRFARGEIKKLMVFMPPQHGKSELTSRRLPAYLLGLNPSLKIVGSSYSADIASSFNREVQRVIDSAEYELIFPDTKLSSKRTKTDARNSVLRNADIFETVGYNGYYKSVGVGGSLTGFTSDILIIDDPVKDAVEANSPTDQQRKWDWYTSVALTRLHNDAQQLITMTRWHKEDLCGKILNKMPEEWEVLHLEAIKKNIRHPKDPRKQGQALWESRHSKKRILSIANANPETFDALFQGDPKPNKSSLYATGFNYGQNVKEVQYKEGLPIHYTVDFNSRPYMTGLVIQMEYIENGYWRGYDSYWEIRIIDKFALSSPNNNSKALGQFLEAKYPVIKQGFFLYGDASGNYSTGLSSDNNTLKTKTLFSDLKSGLSVEAKTFLTERIPNSNPRYRSIGKGMLGRRFFLNEVLSGNKPTRILINPECTELINDLEECRATANGTMAKPKTKDGVEKNGHMLQAFEYYICHKDSIGYLATINK